MARIAPLLGAWLVVAGCTSDNPGFEGDVGETWDGFDGSGDVELPDGVVADGDGAVGDDDGAVGDDDGADVGDVWGETADGGCTPFACQAHTYACGNCLDDDGDTSADWADPDCLGPCDNNEAGFHLGIPGGDSRPCGLDCYFDQDQGSGNDQCNWDQRCDPAVPDPGCPYQDPPPSSATCPSVQDPDCLTICMPLVPNGCDCFGCCELPAGSGRWVFIGTTDTEDVPTCDLAHMSDDALCRPCTPVEDCLNGCGPCELCLGRTELPPECFGGEDGGVPGERCPPDIQPCGLPGDPLCPETTYCITGCCQPILL